MPPHKEKYPVLSGANAEGGIAEYTYDALGNTASFTACGGAGGKATTRYGAPNSSVDILDNAGNITTRRWYDSKGYAYRDVNMTNHGNAKLHPEYPHEHFWDWTSGTPKRNK